jgi:hypothetical protein
MVPGATWLGCAVPPPVPEDDVGMGDGGGDVGSGVAVLLSAPLLTPCDGKHPVMPPTCIECKTSHLVGESHPN